MARAEHRLDVLEVAECRVPRQVLVLRAQVREQLERQRVVHVAGPATKCATITCTCRVGVGARVRVGARVPGQVERVVDDLRAVDRVHALRTRHKHNV